MKTLTESILKTLVKYALKSDVVADKILPGYFSLLETMLDGGNTNYPPMSTTPLGLSPNPSVASSGVGAANASNTLGEDAPTIEIPTDPTKIAKIKPIVDEALKKIEENAKKEANLKAEKDRQLKDSTDKLKTAVAAQDTNAVK